MADITNAATTQQYEEENYEQKCLCVLVLDTSGSMNASGAIKGLNDGLVAFKNDTMQDPVTRDRLEVAIVSFNSKVDVVQQPDILPNIQIPTLQASGQTQLVAAIEKAQEIIDARKQYYKSQGIPYYRPWIVVMTDGDPYPAGQDVDGIAAKIKADAADKKYVFFIIGIGDDVQDSVLTKLATPEFPSARMDTVKFGEFFTWLSASASIVVTDNLGNTQAATPTIDWAQGFVIPTDAD